jgi:ribonuclease HI
MPRRLPPPTPHPLPPTDADDDAPTPGRRERSRSPPRQAQRQQQAQQQQPPAGRSRLTGTQQQPQQQAARLPFQRFSYHSNSSAAAEAALPDPLPPTDSSASAPAAAAGEPAAGEPTAAGEPAAAAAAEAEPGAYRLEFDGGSRNNGSSTATAGYGFAIFAPSGGLAAQQAGPMMPGSTNNEAEYTALVRGLEAALRLGARQLLVLGDSDLVCKQVNGLYRVHAANLQPLHARAKQLALRFDSFAIRHIYREQNTTADQLSNVGMDLAHVLCQVARDPEGAGDGREREGLLRSLQQAVGLGGPEVQRLRDAPHFAQALAEVLPAKVGLRGEDLLGFVARCGR